MPDLFFLSICFFPNRKDPWENRKDFFSFPFLQKVAVLHSLAELAVSASIGELLQIKFRDNINMLLLINGKVKSKVRDKKKNFSKHQANIPNRPGLFSSCLLSFLITT